MNNPEAEFILGACRPDGRDAGDPMFAEALARAEGDPELRAWFERQRKFDTALAGKLHEIAPPAGLRESILAGSRASQPRKSWWRHPTWLASAAAVVLVAAISLTLPPRENAPGISEFRSFAMNDLANAHDDHVGFPPEFADLQARLATAAVPLTSAKAIDLDLDELRRKRCRSVTIAGREVFEICFKRGGTWYHLYAARRSDFAPGPADAKALAASRGEYAATAWADANYVYALVTHAGVDALRRVI